MKKRIKADLITVDSNGKKTKVRKHEESVQECRNCINANFDRDVNECSSDIVEFYSELFEAPNCITKCNKIGSYVAKCFWCPAWQGDINE